MAVSFDLSWMFLGSDQMAIIHCNSGGLAQDSTDLTASACRNPDIFNPAVFDGYVGATAVGQTATRTASSAPLAQESRVIRAL